MGRKRLGLHREFGWGERVALAVSQFAASTLAFLLAVTSVLVWAALGPMFHYSDTWQLVINTGTTVVTFLMVFLIQRTQERESLALQLKLNELIAALKGPSNRLVDIESLSESDLTRLREHFTRLAAMAEDATDISESHSIDKAESRHAAKQTKRAKSASRHHASPSGKA